MPTALGHEFWLRSSTSTTGDRFDQKEVVGAGHSDYWGQELNTREPIGVAAGSSVREFLRFPIGQRTPTGRYAPSLTTDWRPVLEAREIAARSTGM